ASRDGIEDEARVEGRDEGDVDVQTGRILDLGELKPVEGLAFFLGHEIDLTHVLAELRSLENPFKAGETAARSGPVDKDLAADTPGEHPPDHEGRPRPDAALVEPVTVGLVVGRKDNNRRSGTSIIKVAAPQ